MPNLYSIELIQIYTNNDISDEIKVVRENSYWFEGDSNILICWWLNKLWSKNYEELFRDYALYINICYNQILLINTFDFQSQRFDICI